MFQNLLRILRVLLKPLEGHLNPTENAQERCLQTSWFDQEYCKSSCLIAVSISWNPHMASLPIPHLNFIAFNFVAFGKLAFWSDDANVTIPFNELLLSNRYGFLPCETATLFHLYLIHRTMGWKRGFEPLLCILLCTLRHPLLQHTCGNGRKAV